MFTVLPPPPPPSSPPQPGAIASRTRAIVEERSNACMGFPPKKAGPSREWYDHPGVEGEKSPDAAPRWTATDGGRGAGAPRGAGGHRRRHRGDRGRAHVA